ncbi:pre-B-cell leukemia transcription factor-interacting protein 1 isoform X2 [Cheilinus undulatus]|uniref:pre-B-cell leukemia transcription factor-interacting protein 1 isoform X2 n=1 Tax=Cheilinus undulatus TaxID=241271 RepID=UPI001BD1E86A|nr:pre-B-cell leukemia transcription factor-interacting protein 1 isoform X2 [Cheilinus undulatus]
MSDNSHSTGSSGSSTNSWTLLSPEEAAVENVGPVDDGTESLGDAPSLSEDLTGATVEFKPSDISVETVLSEEGHQVCQETSPESGEGPIPSSPSRLSPLPPNTLDTTDLDQESQPPVIHDIVTSSPGDNEPLGVTPFVTSIDLCAPLDIPASELPLEAPEESCSAPPLAAVPITTEEAFDTAADATLIPAQPIEESPVFPAEPEVSVPTETLTAPDPPSHVEADISTAPESTELPSQVPESPVVESPVTDSPAAETVGAAEAEQQQEEEEEEVAVEEEEVAVEEEFEPSELVTQEERQEEEPSSSFDSGDTSGFDDGLRRRNVPAFEPLRPRTSDEEDEEEEVEFKMEDKKEEKPFFSLNKCIVGALIMLFLGSLFLSGDFDGTDGEQSQDWLSSDPQDMKELLDKLTQENQQIAQLEAQLQAQKEELDSALKAASGDEQNKAGLEKENVKLKEELSSLPELKKELESLRARVTELTQLTADQEVPPAASSSTPHPAGKDSQNYQKTASPEKRRDTNDGGKLKEELQRQKVLLEESRKRLQGMKKDGGDRKRVRDSLEEIQRKLSEQVEKWGKKKPQEAKWKGNKGKTNERDHWKKEEKKEWRGEKDWKHSKDGGWREKEEKKEKDRRSEKQNSHKEAWRKHQDEWERKKGERRMDREERRKEKPWHSKHERNAHSHHHHHQQQQQHQHHHHHQQPRQPHQHNQAGFWRDQEQKLRRNIRPQLGCSSSEDCAAKDGLYPVELPEFEELLEGYLSKLEGSSSESKDKIRKLTAEFFEGGVFIHDRVLFSDFAEDVADILEDLVDVLEDDAGKDDDSLEEEMEEFEREALWKFAATA